MHINHTKIRKNWKTTKHEPLFFINMKKKEGWGDENSINFTIFVRI